MSSTEMVAWALAACGGGAAAAIQRQMARRLELVARACHEVRGPLGAARLGLDTVARGALGPAAQRLAAVDLELRRAGLALDDLDAARAGRRAREQRDSVDVGELLREAADVWRPLATARGGRVLVHLPPDPQIVRGDRLRLAQACSNLVVNAIEHGRGSVRVDARRAGTRVLVEVRDDGPGLPFAIGELQRARARLGRGGRPRGRGLAIVAEIAERHGGRLVQGQSSRGACLALELPAVGVRAGAGHG